MEQRGATITGGGTYCVTGANGFIGSWLVKFLLEKGLTVHATVRNPANCDHVVKSWGGVGDRLKMFKADLHEEGSFDDAVLGCYGVFHVAASLDDVVVTHDKDDKYIQSSVIDPSIKGAMNILKSCLRSKSVKRVVFTSSISTLTARDDRGEWLPIVDESCQIPIDIIWKTKIPAWVYILSKRLTEDVSFKFANENGINLVSIITSAVSGPLLTSTVPLSIRVILSPVTGDSELLPILSVANETMG